tara:strand:+ start:116 stop:385 length:270 start_codon:yes stop_codon:yes gene_type:complete
MTNKELAEIAQNARQAWYYTDCEYAGPTLESIYKEIEASLELGGVARHVTTSQALDDVLTVAESDPLYAETLKPQFKRVLELIEGKESN